jgi:hypothetical protein
MNEKNEVVKAKGHHHIPVKKRRRKEDEREERGGEGTGGREGE